MSTRTTLRPHAVVTAGDMVGDITSQVTILQSLSRLSYAVSWAGSTPVGTISVEVSNDYQVGPDGQAVLNAGTWNALTFSYNGGTVSALPVAGNTGNGFIDILDTAAFAARLVYTAGSGTGALQATVVGKVS